MPTYDDPPMPHAWDSIGNLRERLARAEVELRHATEDARLISAHAQEAMQLIAQRQQGAVDRLHAVDTRLQAAEAQIGENNKAIAESKPLIEQYARLQARIRLLKDAANWIAAGTTIYLALSGKISWADVLRALGRILGAG